MTTTYNDLLAWRADHPRKSKWANNTYIREEMLDDLHTFVVRLHNTDIVRISADRIWFNTAGWNTVTTKARMNEFSPLSIVQRNWEWFVTDDFGHTHHVNVRWDVLAVTNGNGVYTRG